MKPLRSMRHALNLLLGTTAMLVVSGLVFIYSSSSVYALEHYGSPSYFLRKQCIGVCVGLLALGIARYFPLRWLYRYAPCFFFSTLLLTALTLVSSCARRIHGSQRWLTLQGFSFQPSELLKISCVIYLAYLLTSTPHVQRHPHKVYGWCIMLVGTTALLLLQQPDFGLATTLVLTACILCFIAHLPIRYILYTIASFIPLAMGLVYYKPYRLKRIITFLDPWADPQGAGFQVIQSLIAIGSGGWWGVGISHSKQKFFYLPMQHTDFIFSIIAEETGLIGVIIIIGLYLTFLYAGLKLAVSISDRFLSLLVSGCTSIITLQAIIHLSVTVGLVPTKGIGLPFVSYGNSALVCNLTMIGLMMNVAHYKQ